MLARMRVCVCTRAFSKQFFSCQLCIRMSVSLYFKSLSLLSCNNVSAHVQSAKRNTHILSLYLSVSHILYSSLSFFLCASERVYVFCTESVCTAVEKLLAVTVSSHLFTSFMLKGRA